MHLLRSGDDNHWARELHAQVLAELPSESDADDALFARWIDNTGFVYRLATRMGNEALGKMGMSFKAPGPAERELWQMQQRALSVRACVCLCAP